MTGSDKRIEREIPRIQAFIQEQVNHASAKGVVLGISGGIDSSVVAAISVRALGSKRVTGVLMFEDEAGDDRDLKDARILISTLKLNVIHIQIGKVFKAVQEAIKQSGVPVSRITLANIKARIRMTLLYAVANERKLLVIGTGDRSEELIGYFTKYGDGGVDFMPIAHLYKTQVRKLGRFLGVPERIIEKPSSPNLWRGHRASDELPFDYSILDKVLELIFDKNKSHREASDILGVSDSKVKEVIRRYNSSKHKRAYPPAYSDLS